MREKVNKKDRLDRLQKEIEMTLEKEGLPKLNLFLAKSSKLQKLRDRIIIQYDVLTVYPDGAPKGIVEFKETVFIWFIVQDIVIRRFGDGKGVFLKYYRIQDAPVYVRVFHKHMGNIFRDTFIVIEDLLPTSLTVTVYTKFDLKKNREEMLRYVTPTDIPPESKREVEKIIKDDKLSFKEALDRIITFSANEIEFDFSYCMTCGIRIQENKKFCDSAKVGNYANRDNCRNKFRNWVRDRLDIDNKDDRAKVINKLYENLQFLIRRFPLNAHEKLKESNPKLFERVKRSRAKGAKP